MSKIICKNEGKFTIDGKDIVLKVGDVIPAVLEQAALTQGWGEKTSVKKASSK